MTIGDEWRQMLPVSLGQIVSLVMLSNNTVITFKRLQSRSLLLVSLGIIQAEQFILINFV